VFGVFAAGAAATLAGQLLLQAIGAYFGIDFNLGGPAQDGYLELSRNIAAGNGYVFDAGGPAVLHRPPLYPYVLAGLVAISGSALPVVVIVFQALLAGGLAAIAYANARVWFDARTGLVAAAFVAACPWLQYNVKNTAAGILVAFLYALFFTLVLRWARRPVQAPRAELLAGVGLGALGAALLLSHGVMQLAVPGLLAMGAIHAWLRRSPRHVLAFAVALGVAVAGVVPWTIRNYAVSGHFIPVASNNGVAYFLGEYH
jgi:4-amino-4-deoxy-L-arabinose transferase-like glycosyltransferase